MTKADFVAANPKATQTLDIEDFVPNWLLIKRHDEFAEEEAKLKPAAQKKAAKTSAALPDFTRPQLAQLVTKPPQGKDWIHEIKFDGYRIQAHVVNGKVKIFTRRGHVWTDKYKSLARILENMDVESAVTESLMC